IDRADLVLSRELLEHGRDHILDVALLVTEIVEQRLQRGVDDLQLGGGQLQPVGDLAWLDQFAGHLRTQRYPGRPASANRPRPTLEPARMRGGPVRGPLSCTTVRARLMIASAAAVVAAAPASAATASA